MSEIHFRIADLRRTKQLTQAQLADIVGVSFQTISKWENGSAMPDITYLPALAEFFEVSVDQLLGLVPLPKEK
nr:helix-turn-helix domain-containing protein [Acetatifactor sp.]